MISMTIVDVLMLHSIIVERKAVATQVGAAIAKLHNEDIVHGDLTTSNMLIRTKNNSAVRVFMMYCRVLSSTSS